MPITSRNMHMLITSTIFLRSELKFEFFNNFATKSNIVIILFLYYL